MTCRRITQLVSKLCIVSVLVAVPMTVDVSPAHAVAVSDGGVRTAHLSCDNLTGTFTLSLPFQPAQPMYTIFAVSIDGSDWAYSDWKFSTMAFTQFRYANGWSSTARDETHQLSSGVHAVSAWAWHVANGIGWWVNLQSCDAGNIF